MPKRKYEVCGDDLGDVHVDVSAFPLRTPEPLLGALPELS